MIREELYALVWSQPMRTVAKSMGISDVALAKQCKKANIPVPPRGWWAKKEAGKPVKVQPLPSAPFVMGNYFPAMDGQTEGINGAGSGGERGEDGETPSPPVFRDMAVVSQEIRAAVRTIKVPSTLTDPHPIVVRLLKQDEERKSNQSSSGYLSDYYGPKFIKPIQQRRLRILSAILIELERLGCRISGSTHAGERFGISVGSCSMSILFGIEGGTSGSSFYRDHRYYSEIKGEQLRFDLTDYPGDRDPPERTWRDGEQKLEQQVSEVVAGLLLNAEEKTRKWTLWRYKSDIEEKARRSREAKLAAEKAAIDRIARKKEAEEAKIRLLLDGAKALEKAARIRRYVAAVRIENDTLPEPAAAELVEAWADWALTQADRIDPVRSGRFLTDLNASAVVEDEAEPPE